MGIIEEKQKEICESIQQLKAENEEYKRKEKDQEMFRKEEKLIEYLISDTPIEEKLKTIEEQKNTLKEYEVRELYKILKDYVMKEEANEEIFKKLYENEKLEQYGANYRNREGETLLYAVMYNTKIVEYLIEKGGDPLLVLVENCKKIYEQYGTVEMQEQKKKFYYEGIFKDIYALKKYIYSEVKEEEKIQKIEEHKGILKEYSTINKWYLLRNLAEKPKYFKMIYEIVEYEVDSKDENGNTLLHIVKNVELIEYLIEKGGNPTIKNNIGESIYENDYLTIIKEYKKRLNKEYKENKEKDEKEKLKEENEKLKDEKEKLKEENAKLKEEIEKIYNLINKII